MKTLFGNLLLLIVSFALVFLIGEVASRYLIPISPGPQIVDLPGKPQKISYIEPGARFRIITPDFDALTTITADGYRAPQSNGNPEIVFVGDSFTYAQGVEDHQTFPAIYCKERKIECINLGVPGASTLFELDHLEHYLKTRHWSPNRVYFFFFSGNDFSDNLAAAEKRNAGKPYHPEELNITESMPKKGMRQRVVEAGLKNSNLLRVAYFKVLPLIRNKPEEREDALRRALEITGEELKRLQSLSEQYAFAYTLFAIFPREEIEQNLDKALTTRIQSIAPGEIVPLGDLFRDDPAHYFFPTDGHFSHAGNRKLADFLLKNF